MPATRNERSTAGPAVSWATVPASEKMPAPMMPPTPMAVSDHSPRERFRPPSPDSSSIWSIGLRRRIERADWFDDVVMAASEVGCVGPRLAGEGARGRLDRHHNWARCASSPTSRAG